MAGPNYHASCFEQVTSSHEAGGGVLADTVAGALRNQGCAPAFNASDQVVNHGHQLAFFVNSRHSAMMT